MFVPPEGASAATTRGTHNAIFRRLHLRGYQKLYLRLEFNRINMLSLPS